MHRRQLADTAFQLDMASGSPSAILVAPTQAASAPLPTAITNMLAALANHDDETYRHSLRVGQVACEVALLLDYQPQDLHGIYVAGLLHDIGKINIPRSVLRQRVGYTLEDYRMLATHVAGGVHLLQRDPRLAVLTPIVGAHHERPDGRGYPHGLGFNDIPAPAFVIAAADAVDTMLNGCKQDIPLTLVAIQLAFHAGAGTCWDRNVVAAVLHWLDDAAASIASQLAHPLPSR